MALPRRLVLIFALWLLALACAESEPDRCEELRSAAPAPSEAGQGGEASGGDSGAGGDAAPPLPSAPPELSDEYAQGVTIAVHPRVKTVLVVTWMQALAADQTWLEFEFDGVEMMRSRPKPGSIGEHRDVVLGVPGETEVTVRVVSSAGATEYASSDYHATTGAVPSGMPLAELFDDDPARRSRERWMFGSVEDSLGGRYYAYYTSTFWLYIMDRQGRIVWYYADPTTNATSSFQRVARDGEYIWIDKARTGTRSVLKTTLDRMTYSQTVSVPGLGDSIDVTTDGSLLYDANNELREMNKAGTIRTVWSCRTALGAGYNCYTNTVNWDPASDTVLMSFPEPNTVRQINRQTGAIVATYGDDTGSYSFSPTTWSLEWQHYANITPQGTLMVSTHLSTFPEGSTAGANQHAFVEFTIDRTTMRLTEKWSYVGAFWPESRGEAHRQPNGNILCNYGTGGTMRFDWLNVFGNPTNLVTSIPLNSQVIGNKLVLNWSGSGFALQAAPEVTGAYTNIPGATSPYTNTIAGPRMFFRLKSN